MLSLATVINFTSDIFASCSTAAVSAASKLSSFSFASVDQLNLNYAPFLIYSLLLSLACYFAFNSLAVMSNLLKTPNSFDQEESDDSEIELSSIDPLVQLKLIKEDSAAEPEVIDTTVNSASTSNTEKRTESSTALVIYQPSKVFQRSRRNSIKSRSKGPCDIGYVNLSFTLTGPDNNIIVPPNHERITLIDDNASDIFADPQESASPLLEKKPFEYYLRWDLSMNELEQLSYSEKCRRFYLLSKYGEINLESKPPEMAHDAVDQEAKPPETAHDAVKKKAKSLGTSQAEVEQEVNTPGTAPVEINQEVNPPGIAHIEINQEANPPEIAYGIVKQESKSPGTSQAEVKQEVKSPNTAHDAVNQGTKPAEISQLKGLPPEPAKPMNLISDLVQQASSIDIPTFQVKLLKLNHQLVHSHLKQIEMKKFNFSPSNILRRIYDLSSKNQLKQSAIRLDSAIDDRSNRKNLRGSFSLTTNQCYATIDYDIFNPKLKLLK